LGQAGKLFSAIGKKLYKGFVVEKDIDPDYIDHTKIRAVLVILRHRMGDMICALPMLHSLRKNYPKAKIVLLTNNTSGFDEIFRGVKAPVDEVLYYSNGLEQYFSTLKLLQAERFDLAVIPSTVVFSGTNHMFAYHSHAGIRAGVRSKDFDKNPMAYLLNLKNDFDWGIKKVHQIERNLDIIRQIKVNPAENTVKLELSSESISYAGRFFETNFPDKAKKVIGFHPGAGKETNVWPAENFAELVMMLKSKFDPYFFISEGPQDMKFTSRLRNMLIEKYSMKDAVFHNGKLMDNAAIIERLNLFITNDTGIMHIASGLKTPVIALFGEPNAYEWGPAGENKYSIQSPNGKITGTSCNSVFSLAEKLLK
jgi:ADP-heptose:LPS heptosyltransferase